MVHTVELGQDGTPRGPGPDPLIGKLLLHYRVDEVIGQGGMSVVYRGHDENLKRDVAIKVLHPFLAEKPECRARLAREARAVARLEHPHILKVFDFSGDPDTIEERPPPEGKLSRVKGFAEGFIVAELVRGSTLKRFAEQNDLWRVPEVGAMVLWQIALALQHAHEHGVVHRDLKPENVMVREDGWLKLMDFGIAQITDQKGLTITGTLLGSPAHMAPECIDGHPADERSDLFSLGTVLYWIATGQLPFEALTPHALLKQIVEGRATPVQQRSPRVSDDLARVIAKAMATKPSERFENASQLVAALADVLERAGLPADVAVLRTILANPDVELPKASAAVRAAYLKRAEAALAEGQQARALACLNRVLAEDKDDVDAKVLLEKVHDEPPTLSEITDDDKPVPALVNAPSIDDHTSVTGVPATIVRTTETPPTSLPRMLQQAAIIALAAVLIGGAIAVAVRLDDGRTTTTTTKDAPAKTAETPTPSAPADDAASPIELGSPDVGEKSATKSSTKHEAPKATSIARVTPPATTNATATKEPAKVETATRKVTIRVNPWANIFIDGALKAQGKPRLEIELPIGRHQIVLKNPNLKEVNDEIDVELNGKDDFAYEPERLPAQIVVHCNVKDAVVGVEGHKTGAPKASETEERPLLVALKDGSEDVVIDVVKDGYTSFRKEFKLIAGQKLPIDVTLTPLH